MRTTKEIFMFDIGYEELVAGVDEAGRGPLAGPVVCAACIMPLANAGFCEEYYLKNINSNLPDLTIFQEKFVYDSKISASISEIMIEGINDSKTVSEKNREALFEKIVAKAIAYSVSVVGSDIIDKINILQATKMGMCDAIKSLNIEPNIVLVDAVSDLDIPYRYKSLIKGDAMSYNIACASIIAKVTRDRIMCDFDKIYQGYGFSKNKGYGTKQHIDALKKIGATPIHRKLFIRNAMSEQLKFTI